MCEERFDLTIVLHAMRTHGRYLHGCNAGDVVTVLLLVAGPFPYEASRFHAAHPYMHMETRLSGSLVASHYAGR